MKALLLLFCAPVPLCLCAPAVAQNPPVPVDSAQRADSLRADSLRRAGRPSPRIRADSALPDSLDPDTLRPVLPAVTPAGPMARAGRWIFDDDALRFLGALDLADLLRHVPGVFVVRAGWYGQTSFVSYAGQGAVSVELYWDGYAMEGVGSDSSALDLGRVTLGLARRVEVEVLPSVLRVYLISDTQPWRRAKTEASFATGDATTNTYRIRYLNRWRSGLGIGVGVNWYGTDGPSTSPGQVADLTLWSKLTWTPSALTGIEVQLLSYGAKHDSLRTFGITAGPGITRQQDTRRDLMVRGHLRAREDGLGAAFEALVGGTTFTDTTGFERTLAQAGLTASLRGVRWSGEVGTRIRDSRTPLEFRARGGWSPADALTLSLFGIARRHTGSRSSVEAGGTGEIRFGALALHGAFRWRDAVPRPDLVADTAQTVGDWSAGVALTTRLLGLDVGVERHGAFEAPTWDVLRAHLPEQTGVDVVTLTSTVRVSPFPYLTLSGWYRHPLDPVLAAYEPRHHTNAALTFRSRMLPRFRRGVFDVLFQMSVEGWGDGVAGRTSGGAPIFLEGATRYNYLFEVKLVGAVLFWTMQNVGAERYTLVPGFFQGRSLQRFGVRWEFTN